jgi:hypothetical protein
MKMPCCHSSRRGGERVALADVEPALRADRGAAEQVGAAPFLVQAALNGFLDEQRDAGVGKRARLLLRPIRVDTRFGQQEVQHAPDARLGSHRHTATQLPSACVTISESAPADRVLADADDHALLRLAGRRSHHHRARAHAALR